MDAFDLSADCGGEVGDLCGGLEEVGECWVCVFAVFVVLEGLEGRVDLVFVPCWEIVWILRYEG